MEEAHGNRLDGGCSDPLDECRNLRFGKRDADFSARAEPLGDLEAQVARRQRRRLDVERVIQARNADTPDLQHVAKAARCHQRRARPAPLEDGVGRHRAAVQHLGNVARMDAGFAK